MGASVCDPKEERGWASISPNLHMQPLTTLMCPVTMLALAMILPLFQQPKWTFIQGGKVGNFNSVLPTSPLTAAKPPSLLNLELHYNSPDKPVTTVESHYTPAAMWQQVYNCWSEVVTDTGQVQPSSLLIVVNNILLSCAPIQTLCRFTSWPT